MTSPASFLICGSNNKRLNTPEISHSQFPLSARNLTKKVFSTIPIPRLPPQKKGFTETRFFKLKPRTTHAKGLTGQCCRRTAIAQTPLLLSPRKSILTSGWMLVEVLSPHSQPSTESGPCPRSPTHLSPVPSEPSSPAHHSPGGGQGILYLPSPKCTATPWQASSPLYFIPWLQKLLFPLLITFLLPMCLFLDSALFLH